jgi:hypothetical protein
MTEGFGMQHAIRGIGASRKKRLRKNTRQRHRRTKKGLGSKKSLYEAFGQTHELQVESFPSGCRLTDWTLLREPSTPNRKEEMSKAQLSEKVKNEDKPVLCGIQMLYSVRSVPRCYKQKSQTGNCLKIIKKRGKQSVAGP